MTEIMEKSRETKSLLAKLMAAENINVEYSEKATTAAFDTEGRTLVMPVIKDVGEAATDLFLGHEVGHALYTPQGAIKDVMAKGGQFKSVVNIVEDARIEKMIQSKFPGLRRDFYEGYGELVDRDFFSINGKDVNAMGFMDRLNIHFKLGFRAGVKFSDEETAYVDRMSSLRSFDDAIKLSEDLWDYCSGKDEEEPETGMDDATPEFDDESNDGDMESDMPMDFDGSDDSEDSDENEDGPGSPGDTESEDSEEEAEDGDSGDDGEGDAEDEEKPEGDVGDTNSGRQGGDETSAAKKNLETATQDSFDRKLEGLVDTETEYHYATVPKLDLTEVIVPMAEIHKVIDENIAKEIKEYASDYGNEAGESVAKGMVWAKEEFDKFSSAQKSLISYLVKEFEMRKSADEHKRTREGKTGILNPNKLHAYKFSEDLFLRNSIVADGKNHGFVMFLDWSGSMSHSLGDTMDQLMLLALFCKKANIPFDVFAFSNHYGDEHGRREDRSEKYTAGHGDLVVGKSFKLLHLISSTLSTSNFNKSMIYLTYLKLAMTYRSYGYYGPDSHSARVSLPSRLNLGGTPLSEAIIAALEVVPAFQKKNGVQIVNTIFLTDGEGTPMRSKWDSGEGIVSFGSGTGSKAVISDPVTKRQYNHDQWRDHHVFFNILKDRTNCRVVGFFIAPSRKQSFYTALMSIDSNAWDGLHEKWESVKKDGYLLVEAGGYDQMFMIPENRLKEVEEIQIDSDMTKAKMKNAFIKNRQNKIASKTMLSKFAEFVS